MNSRTIQDSLAEAFHAVPDECWTPRHTPSENRQSLFWLQHLYAGENEIAGAEATWVQAGVWPELSERARYFLRLQIEDTCRTLSSDQAPDIRPEIAHILDAGTAGRKAVLELLAEIWTRDMARQWADEAAKFGDPRRVYMPER
jgi:hypothetical protein